MSPIVDGQPVNAAATNAAFLYKDTNDTSTGSLTLAGLTLSTTPLAVTSGGTGVTTSTGTGNTVRSASPTFSGTIQFPGATRVGSTGLIGINTASPNIRSFGKAITVNANTGTDTAVELSVNNASVGELLADATRVVLNAYANVPLVFRTNNIECGRFADTSGAFSAKGSATNDSASAGYIGEYLESVVSTPASAPTSTQWGDLTSISLTAGDWDVTASATCILNGGTATVRPQVGISTTSGNSATGLIDGSNWIWMPASPTSTPANSSGAVPNYRMSLNATTTVYLKVQFGYSAGTPQFQGRLSARRVR